MTSREQGGVSSLAPVGVWVFGCFGCFGSRVQIRGSGAANPPTTRVVYSGLPPTQKAMPLGPNPALNLPRPLVLGLKVSGFGFCQSMSTGLLLGLGFRIPECVACNFATFYGLKRWTSRSSRE